MSTAVRDRQTRQTRRSSTFGAADHQPSSYENFLRSIRDGWRSLTTYVTPARIELVRKYGPYAIFAYCALTILGIKTVHQHPRTKLLYARIYSFARTRYAKQFGSKVLPVVIIAYSVVTAAFWTYIFAAWYKIVEQPVPTPGQKLDKRPLLAFSGSIFLYPFHWGAMQYVKDHFETKNIRVEEKFDEQITSIWQVHKFSLRLKFFFSS